jgi:hypothetical protein
VPRIVLRSDSQEKLELARIYIYKRHEEWVENLEKEREKRSERIMKKMRR